MKGATVTYSFDEIHYFLLVRVSDERQQCAVSQFLNQFPEPVSLNRQIKRVDEKKIIFIFELDSAEVFTGRDLNYFSKMSRRIIVENRISNCSSIT